MPDKTFKIIEVVGISDESIQQAVRNAVAKASETLRHIDWFEVAGIRGYVRPNGDPEFQVQVKIGFRLDDRPIIEDIPRPTSAPRTRGTVRKLPSRRRPTR
jgi:dodecin